MIGNVAGSEADAAHSGHPRPDLARKLEVARELNSQAWAESMAVRAFGVRIGVRVTDPKAMDAVRGILPPDWSPAPRGAVDILLSLRREIAEDRRGSPEVWGAYANSQRIVRAGELTPALDAVENSIDLRMALRAPHRVFVHAGAVLWRGRAIVLPGNSHHGKTTLVRELLRAGAEYLSDEFAVLDRRGRIYRYARPLNLRALGESEAHRWMPERVADRRPYPVALVVCTRYDAETEWRPHKSPYFEAVLEVLSHTVPARRRACDSGEYVCQMVAGAQVLTGPRGDAAETVPRILEYINRRIQKGEVA